MKKFFTSMGLVFITLFHAYGQGVNPTLGLTREHYLKKSQNQKVGSVLLVVAGCTIGLVGGLASAVSAGGNSGPSFPIVPVAIGVGCLAGSVALSKASARNQQKAVAATSYLEFKRMPSITQAAVSAPNYLTFTLKLALH